MDVKLIKFIAFFSYIGFYVGISILLALGYGELTRFYSVPIRLILCFIMLIFAFYFGTKNNTLKIDWFAQEFIYIFWLIYIIKAYLDLNDPYVNYSKSPFEFIFYTISFCIIPFVAFKYVDLNKYANTILNTIIFSGFVLGCVSVYLYSDIILSGNLVRINQAKYLGFEIGTISPLILSYTSALTFVFVLFKLSITKDFSLILRVYYILTILVSLILLVLGASRGSLIALILSVVVMYFFGNDRLRKRLLIILTISSPFLLWGLFRIGSSLISRMSTVTNLQDDNSASLRMEYWDAAIREFFDYPFFGGRLEIGGIYPHNIFIEILMSTGFIGFIAFVTFVLFCLKRSILGCMENPQRVWILVFFIQALVHYNFTESIYLSNALFISAGLICSKTFKS